MTLRDLYPGDAFRLYTRYRDNTWRARYTFKPFNFGGVITVLEQHDGYTLLEDERGNRCPMCPDITLKQGREFHEYRQ